MPFYLRGRDAGRHVERRFGACATLTECKKIVEPQVGWYVICNCRTGGES